MTTWEKKVNNEYDIWIEVAFGDLKKGDMFRIAGDKEFIVQEAYGNAEYNEEMGQWGIHAIPADPKFYSRKI